MNEVALTFDDGPAVWTEPILDVLAREGAQATFFLIGSLVERHPDIVRRIAQEGHEVGNHSWSHPRLASTCTDEVVREELSRTQEVIERICGVLPVRFRAPQYDVDERVSAIAGDLGLAHTHGDVTPPDWDPRCTTTFIAAYVIGRSRAGSVIGLHDGVTPHKVGTAASQQRTADAVAVAVPRLHGSGLRCVSASTLLGRGMAG